MQELKDKKGIITKEYFEAFEDMDKRAIQVMSEGTHEVGRRKKIGRNEKCPCGSGKKFKYCCIAIMKRQMIKA